MPRPRDARARRPARRPTAAKSSGAAPEDALRSELERLGRDLARRWRELVAALPGAPSGPRRLADALGETAPTASRLLKAIRQDDPLATLLYLPGPEPLRRALAAAAERGADARTVRPAREAVARLEAVIHDVAGDRGRLHALLQGWVPAERAAFELRRRQAAFKAISELKGVACGLDLCTFLLVPSEHGDAVDLACLHGRVRLAHLRADRSPRLGTRNLRGGGERFVPTNLDGASLEDPRNLARLDAFSTLPADGLRVERFDESVHYLLDHVASGGEASVDLWLAEVNRQALPLRPEPDPGAPARFVFHVTELPAEAVALDLVVHRDLFPGAAPRYQVHDTSGDGPGSPHEEARATSLVEEGEPLELGSGLSRAHLLGYPRYRELVQHVLARLRLGVEDFRGFRHRLEYPLPATQISLILPDGDRVGGRF